MKRKESQSPTERRLFLARLGAGATVVGASVAGAAVAGAQVGADSPWRPARHVQDEWLDKIPGEHRFVFDTTTPDGLALAFQFGGNYFNASADAYGLKDSDMAVLIITRHKSTSFGYNDAMWMKYGKQFSEQAEFVDPKTKEAPTVNLYAAADAGGQPSRMNALIKKGVQFAVCQTSSRGIATRIAKVNGVEVDAVMKEMAANLIPNARLVPAGIIAVNRAQEHGYSFVHAM